MRFVLIHGGYHGAWCWDRVTPELEELGHRTLAIDLPGCNERAEEPASLKSWRGALRDVIEDGDVLVGHSMGGFAISLGADEVPDKVGRLIYLSAAVPIEGEAMNAATSDNVASDWPSVVGMPYDEFIEMVELPHQGPCADHQTGRGEQALLPRLLAGGSGLGLGTPDTAAARPGPGAVRAPTFLVVGDSP